LTLNFGITKARAEKALAATWTRWFSIGAKSDDAVDASPVPLQAGNAKINDKKMMTS